MLQSWLESSRAPRLPRRSTADDHRRRRSPGSTEAAVRAPRRRRRRGRRGRTTIGHPRRSCRPAPRARLGVGWFCWQVDAHGQVGRQRAGASSSRAGVCRASREELDARPHRRLVARVQRLLALQRRQLFQAGTYELHKNMGVRDAVAALKAGPHIDYVKLTIPPGFWLKQIAARVGTAAGAERGRRSCEGTRNNAVRSVFEPAGVTNLEGLAPARHVQDLRTRGRDRILQTMVTRVRHAGGEARPARTRT